MTLGDFPLHYPSCPFVRWSRTAVREQNNREEEPQVATLTVRNGVDVGKLMATIEAIQSNPDLARFQFRARSQWEGGARSVTSIQEFHGAGQEDTSRTRPFEVPGDEPAVLLGSNTAPNAVELALTALASCLSVGYVYNAAAQGIQIEALDFDLEGDLDLHAFLGLKKPGESRPGFSSIHVTCHVKADAPRERLVELCEYVQRTSPVLDIIRNPVSVSVELTH